MGKRQKVISEGREKLREWLRGRDRVQVAVDLGMTIHGLERYLSGRARPSMDKGAALERMTGGAVPASSWEKMEQRGVVAA